MRANGFVLHQTSTYTVVATGFRKPSRNRKTGPMVQVWIIPRINPSEAVAHGLDSVVCLDCPLRGDKGKERACYVNVGQAPLAVYFEVIRGSYPRLPAKDIAATFSGRYVRFGAYGEPVLIRESIVRAIANASKGWTGYTHQWRRDKYLWAREYFMASADTKEDRAEAGRKGWRFFATGEPDSTSVVCPSETKGTRCMDCLLCCGTAKKTALDVTIPGHGTGAKYLPLRG